MNPSYSLARYLLKRPNKKPYHRLRRWVSYLNWPPTSATKSGNSGVFVTCGYLTELPSSPAATPALRAERVAAVWPAVEWATTNCLAHLDIHQQPIAHQGNRLIRMLLNTRPPGPNNTPVMLWKGACSSQSIDKSSYSHQWFSQTHLLCTSEAPHSQKVHRTTIP